MGQNVLITGVAGFIGSKVAKKFCDENYNVFGVDDLSSGKYSNIPKQVKFIKGDLSNINILKKLPKRCEKILHLAGQSSGEISFENPSLDLRKNTTSTLNLIHYGIKKKVKLIIYASSMSVYGNNPKKKFLETDKCNPESCYGIGKLTSERYLNLYRNKISFINMRMFNVYGPGQDMKNLKQGMVSIYLAQALKNKRIVVKGSLNRVRDFIYIDDVVDAWFKASLLGKRSNITVNIGSGKPISVKNLLKKIESKIGKFKIINSPGTSGDQFYVCSNNNFLKKVLKKRSFIDLDEGLNKFISSLPQKI